MWRALFLSLGGMLCLIGVESLILDHAVLSPEFVKKTEAVPVYDDFGFQIDTKPASESPRIVHPPEWAPWSMISTGAIVALYAFSYKGGGD